MISLKKQAYLLLCAGVLALTACTSDTAADPQGSAVSSLQMMELNGKLEAQPHDPHHGAAYEVFVYSFCDSDGDGTGDLQGLISKLDYIQDLGFDTIWLMPVNPSDTYHKYDVKDYFAIDPQYGTMADMEQLLKETESRHMQVLMDLVLNHTADDHYWFTQAHDYLKELPADWQPSSDYCPYFDYYHFSRERGEGYVPLADTNWFYEARFWSEMPDLNLDSEKVRNEIAEIMRFWLGKGIAGFRLDAVTSYYTNNTAQNTEFLRWLCDTGKKIDPDCYFVGEAWTEMNNYAQLYQSGIDSLFDFAFADSSGIIAGTMKNSYGLDDYAQALVKEEKLYASMNPQYVNAPFYTNHDMGRSAGYYAGDDGKLTKMAQILNIMMPGRVFVYYGEEIGMKGAGKDENKRAPMYWTEDPDAEGMCSGPPDMDEVKMKFPALDEQQADPLSVYSLVRQALKIRNAFPAIAEGTTEVMEDLCTEETAVILRKDGSHENAMLVFNGASAAEVHTGNQYVQLRAVLTVDDSTVELKDGVLQMPPYSMAVLTEE